MSFVPGPIGPAIPVVPPVPAAAPVPVAAGVVAGAGGALFCAAAGAGLGGTACFVAGVGVAASPLLLPTAPQRIRMPPPKTSAARVHGLRPRIELLLLKTS